MLADPVRPGCVVAIDLKLARISIGASGLGSQVSSWLGPAPLEDHDACASSARAGSSRRPRLGNLAEERRQAQTRDGKRSGARSCRRVNHLHRAAQVRARGFPIIPTRSLGVFHRQWSLLAHIRFDTAACRSTTVE